MSTINAATPEMPIVDGVGHEYIQLPDGRMHVATMGTGAPVLLLPGFAQTWWEWRDLMPALAAAGYLAIAPDLRGEGWSKLPVRGLTRTRRMEDLLLLLDELGLDEARMVSHDIGAISAFQLAVQYPERVTSQVALAVPPLQMRVTAEMVPGMAHLWHQEVLAIPGVGSSMMKSGQLPRWFFSHFTAEPLDADIEATYVEIMGHPRIVKSCGVLCRNMLFPELGRLMRGTYRDVRLEMPSLWVFGSEDKPFPERIVRKAFAHPEIYGRDARLEIVVGAAHFLIDEAPEATTKVILEFFADS
ncbi:alpha/beta fold hydrolase [Gulosibacter molinativorax]|uniref:Alpha/beta hydrolase n=1 Tax=Gulosibacter molinativorax TaxID=256821 RepID=A0ABT7C4B0_9MICO|nr:alpha/beta hydrolase [Gulosibacter molinativorax]MDJ1370057.1 alpha/beta hydrolase [Gulosibacter molinativorax]QUY63750.1 Hypothetical protein GMOLON4_3077 [Gulosibacter molinativorax]